MKLHLGVYPAFVSIGGDAHWWQIWLPSAQILVAAVEPFRGAIFRHSFIAYRGYRQRTAQPGPKGTQKARRELRFTAVNSCFFGQADEVGDRVYT